MQSLPPIDDPWVGTLLDDRFLIQGLIGRGAMGAIYRCRDQQTGLILAIKIIAEGLETNDEIVGRFEREILASERIRHPNVVRMYGHGLTEDGRRYFGMEYVDGTTLAEVMEDAPLSSNQVAHIGMQVALGLGAAHAADCVHRDLKPHNILICHDGTIKICDFGLALLPQLGGNPQTQLTAADTRVGTPIYMAPEYIESSAVDSRSDLYALGVMLYEAACGRPPFTGPPFKVLDMHLTEPLRPLEKRAPGRHPRWLRHAIEDLLKKDPDTRIQTALELLERLSDESLPPQLPTNISTSTAAAVVDQEIFVTPPAVPRRPHTASFTPARQLPAMAWAAVFASALVWHGVAVGIGTGKLETQARDLAGIYYAAQIAYEDQSAYDLPALQKRSVREPKRVRATLPTVPPAGIASMTWTRFASLNQAWGIWLAAQELVLLAFVLLVCHRWRSLGPGAQVGAVVGTCCMASIPLALDLGAPILPPLLLTFLGLQLTSSTGAAVCMGLSAAVFLPSLIAWPSLLRHKEKSTLPLAFVTFIGVTSMALPLLGGTSVGDYFTRVLPTMLAGDFTGVGMRLDSFSNQGLSSLLAVGFPGETGQHLGTVSWVTLWLVGLGVSVGLVRRDRSMGDSEWAAAVQTAWWMLAVLLLPAYTMEANLIWALPALAVVVGALQRGRLDPRWVLPIGVSAAILMYPMAPLRGFHQSLLLPQWPMLATLFSATKLIALLCVAGATWTIRTERNPAIDTQSPCHV